MEHINRIKAAAVGVLAFHPTLIIMSGSVNNDQLMVALTFGAILYAVRWYRRPSLRHILPLACFIGGAMMAKLSGGLVAPAVALLFLLKLIQSKGRRGGLIRQFAVFGAVCVPLGLWWPVRNFLLYQVSPGYVPDLGTDSFQYIGYRTVTERLFDFSPAQFKTVFVAWGEPHFDYNPVLGLFKTAMFGEYRFAATGEAFYVFCAALFWIGAALTLLAFGTMVYGLITRRLIADGGLRCFFLALYLTIFVSYVRFCFVFPFTCTMNIRYAVPLILIGTVFLGKLAQRLEEKPPLSAAGALCRGMLALTAVFCGLSGVVYLSLAG